MDGEKVTAQDSPKPTCTTNESEGTIQKNLSIKDTENKVHLSNEDTFSSPKLIELSTYLPLN